MSCNATFNRKHADKWSRAKSKNGSRLKGKFGVFLVSHCPICPYYGVGKLDRHGMTKIVAGQRTARCREGHTWEVTNKSK
jgi:hypothetical protein